MRDKIKRGCFSTCEICELIVEFSGLDMPFPGSTFRKLRKGDCVNYFLLKEKVGQGAFGTVHRVVEKKTNQVRGIYMSIRMISFVKTFW